MNTETNETQQIQEYLDSRYQRGIDAGQYIPYGPVFGLEGLAKTESSRSAVSRYSRLAKVINILKKEKPESVLDVGCAEGFTAAKIDEILECPVVGMELSVEACLRAKEFTGIQTVTATADKLPFTENSFDWVTITEVVEHLERPLEALAECYRVAKKGVIVTTQEFLPNEKERMYSMRSVNPLVDHVERTFSTFSDWRILFGKDRIRFLSQGSFPLAIRTNLNHMNRKEAVEAILDVAFRSESVNQYLGMIGIIRKDDSDWSNQYQNSAKPSVRTIAQKLLEPVEKLKLENKGSRKKTTQHLRFEKPKNQKNEDTFPPTSLDWLREYHQLSESEAQKVEDRRRFLNQQYSWGGWENHFAHWNEEVVHHRRVFENEDDYQKYYFRMLTKLIRSSIVPLYYAGSSSPVNLSVSPKKMNFREKVLEWHIDTSGKRGIHDVYLEIMPVDQKTKRDNLAGRKGTNFIFDAKRIVPLHTKSFHDTVYPSEGFTTPGLYAVRIQAVGEFGLKIGKPSQVEFIEFIDE